MCCLTEQTNVKTGDIRYFLFSSHFIEYVVIQNDYYTEEFGLHY